MVARPRALHDVTTVETLFEHGRPNSARLYDALLGGKDNYAADRAAMEFISSAAPHVRPAALANRCFMEWVVRRLVADGVTQFIDIGAGYPAGRNVHEIAQRARPGCRVVYADNDPVVVLHGQALLTTGGSRMIEADLRDPASIIENAELRRFLDLERPVALLLLFVLDFVPDDDRPAAIVEQLMRPLAPGSHLAVSHFVADPDGALARVMDEAGVPVHPRSRAEIHAMAGGLDVHLAGPLHPRRASADGLDIGKWRYGLLARKP